MVGFSATPITSEASGGVVFMLEDGEERPITRMMCKEKLCVLRAQEESSFEKEEGKGGERCVSSGS